MPTKLAAASLWTLTLLFGMLGSIVFLILYETHVFTVWLLFGATILLSVLSWLLSPKLLDWTQRFFYKAKYFDRAEFESKWPELATFVDEVCKQQGTPFPKIGFIDDDNPTAFSYGSGRWNSRIVFTQGILTYLEPGEARAVLAHELGHIVHRDFIVMSIANTIIQLLYEVYYVLARRGGDRKDNRLALIGLLAYVFYWIGVYIVLFLSRLREYYADLFSAEVTRKPDDLSQALIKIAYGIMAKEDSDTSKRLLESTRTLGIMGPRVAKDAGLIAKVTSMEPEKVARVMMFDIVSPWAKLAELSSTHPLTGKRLLRLDQVAKQNGQQTLFDLDKMRRTILVDYGRLWKGFFVGGFMYLLPVLLIAASLGFATLIGSKVIAVPAPAVLIAVPVVVLVLLILRTRYKYPRIISPEPTTILNLMSDLYASPVRGRAAKIDGSVVGRGVPGYIFSEDMMLQDNTGLMYLDYQGAVPLVSKLRMALKKFKQLLGQPITAQGWFFRSNSQMLALKNVQTPTGTIRSYARFWSLVGAVFLALLLAIPPALAADTVSQDSVIKGALQAAPASTGQRTYESECFSIKFPVPSEVEESGADLPCFISVKAASGLSSDLSYNLLFTTRPKLKELQATVQDDRVADNSQNHQILSQENITVGGLPAVKTVYAVSPGGSQSVRVLIDDGTFLKHAGSTVTRGSKSATYPETPYFVEVGGPYEGAKKGLVDGTLQGITWKSYTIPAQ